MHQIVPKAPDVADLSHHLVPEAPSLRDGAPSTLACRHTGFTCPALEAIFGALAPSGEEARAWVQNLAPCSKCRVASQSGRDKLRHLRLGQREREILLGAAASDAFTVTEPGMSRSLSAARRRAALSLGKAGLVVSVAKAPASEKTGPRVASRATVALTELGQYVMAAYGRYLETGKPVRWTRPARGVVLPGLEPAGLGDETLARTETALRDTLGELKGVLIAAIARPHTDPGLLDSVTRHLERKATVLKSVLEPRRPRSGV
ncbi:hypothetical protein [Hyphomicrobium sp.]|uniref:hypothetical protein n=1 Tax=Hyphomicrobium sp. TaxID=82 RepID=UPI002E31B532|nr:hypothetical protein [Hyphomicrobium sp.]HEX2840831.1 hypothetical protein [Hyphomicrobium sp.]